MKNIYIAGFDVFRKDALEYGKRLKNICGKYGFNGFFPFNNKICNPKDVFLADLNLIDKSDIIIANLNNFRGYDIDSGTAFELGYGYSKHKVLIGYRGDVRPLTEQLGYTDKNGFNVENFNMPINLMIGMSVKIINGKFEDCLEYIKKEEF